MIKMWSRILFQRGGGYWLFWTSFVYFWVGMYAVFVNPFCRLELIQAVWILIVSLPLWIPSLARWLNLKTFWEMLK